MRLVRHPLVPRDVEGIFEHIVETTQGDLAAAERRLDEIDALIASVAASPLSGVRLSGALEGWLARHGRDHAITVVFRLDAEHEALFIALVAFGGRDWLNEAPQRAASLSSHGRGRR